jgi:hypothetical protein
MSSQVRERISRVETKPVRVSSPFGLSAGELVAGVLALLLFLLVVVYYFTSLKPEQQRLAALESQLALQQDELIRNSEGHTESAAAPDSGKDALDSLVTFRTEHLKPHSQGQIALIKEINAIAKKNSCRLMTGIDMRLENPKKEEQSLSVFPWLEVHFTVFGQYPSLRSFISELERNKQFLVIDSISLTSVEEGQVSRGSAAAGSGVALTINMLTYFQP